ncbi:MAG TPA: hypothetical protein ENK05_00865 [Gammaproteobacteria bacterium]|nr:hypothetical protein [Gammaproteobacteria bacterium]
MLDGEDGVVKECYAVVYAPKKRKRVPANCVEPADSEAAAVAASEPRHQRYAALVAGPSRSSEGQQLYYLVRWLN